MMCSASTRTSRSPSHRPSTRWSMLSDQQINAMLREREAGRDAALARLSAAKTERDSYKLMYKNAAVAIQMSESDLAAAEARVEAAERAARLETCKANGW